MAPTTIGKGRETWTVGPDRVDLAGGRPPARCVALAAEPVEIAFDPGRSAIVVVDMQNAFCAPGGLAHSLGADLAPVRAPIAPLRRLLPIARRAGLPVVWVNWGLRPDQADLPPATLYPFLYGGRGPGLGGALPEGRGPLLEKGSWSAAVVDELAPQPQDIAVDKVRVSGFWNTPLDAILRNLDIRTLFFAGVNVDICVYHTLADASFLGYGCVLLADGCGATSPDFCVEATLFNVKRAFGFVAATEALAGALEGQASA